MTAPARFPDEALDTLFGAILTDDVVDPVTRLPDRIRLDHDPALLGDCYRLSRQQWAERVDLAGLRALIARVRRERGFDAADRVTFRHARARLKHLRFACALFGEDHGYPTVMDWTTTALGHLQDACRTGQAARVGREAWLCRMLLSAGPMALVRHEQDRLRPAGARGFRAFVGGEIGRLAAVLAAPRITGHNFHAARKIVSRQVSFYNCVLAIEPGEEALLMNRSMAAINGLMGALHDDLVERRAAGAQDYHRDLFALPADIRDRIAALVERYRASGLPLPHFRGQADGDGKP